MNEDFNWEDDLRPEELAERFDHMMDSGTEEYFDTDEFESLIDYYLGMLNNEKAAMVLEKAISMHPTSNSLKIRNARHMASEGNYLRALKVLDEVERTEPQNPDLLMTRASVYSLMMDFQKAVREYKKALVVVDEDELEDVYTSIAFEYENMGAYDQALSYLRKALGISSYPDQIIYEIGMCYEMAGKMDEAVTFFGELLEQHPSNVAAWFNIAMAYHQLELYEKAIDAFEYAIAIDDTYLPAYQSLGQSYMALGQYYKALEIFEESIAIEAPEPLIIYYMGECYEKLGQFDMAEAQYRKAIKLDATLPEAWAGLAVVAEEKGDIKNALKYIEQAIAYDGNNTDFLLIQAEMYIRNGLFEKAKAVFQRIEEIDPGDPDLWLDFAVFYLKTGELGNAVQVLKTGLIHQPNNTAIQYRLVAMLLLNNSINQALFYLENALAKDIAGLQDFLHYFPAASNYPAVMDMIGSYHQAVGDATEGLSEKI
ncbi:MAG TPA: tetratricopeptide repeat protein [Bacteroidales bacterium]|nr:tetratricopeptide repeat protein [Bacteroidales bacterium]